MQGTSRQSLRPHAGYCRYSTGGATDERSGAVVSAFTGRTPTDAVTYGGVFGVLALASLVACYVPARRASRINPIRALRYE